MARADLMRMVLMAFTLLMVVSQTALPVPEGSGNAAILSLAQIAFLFGSAEVISSGMVSKVRA